MQILITRARKEKVILALDTELGPTEKVRKLLNKYIVDTLTEIHGNNGDINIILKNLNIIDGKGKNLVQRLNSMISKGALKKENVIMLTTERNFIFNCDELSEHAFITAIDARELSGEEKYDYYPIVELAFFAILRTFTYETKEERSKYAKRLWGWYRQIPNTERVNIIELMDMCFEKNGTPRPTIILNLVPRAKKFEHEELEELYRRIHECKRKA